MRGPSRPVSFDLRCAPGMRQVRYMTSRLPDPLKNANVLAHRWNQLSAVLSCCGLSCATVFDFCLACHHPPPLAEVFLESGPCERKTPEAATAQNTNSLSSIFSSVGMQAGLDRVNSENSDLVAWTEQMRASCFISDAPCRALSDASQHKKPGEEERGAQGTAKEGGQGAQTQSHKVCDSHHVPFVCYFAMSTLLSIKQAGQTPNVGAKATQGFGAPAAGPEVGSIVTIISGVTGAPAGHSSAGLSVGMKLEIAQVMHWQNAWYATCTRWTTLWFPLSSTDWRDTSRTQRGNP